MLVIIVAGMMCCFAMAVVAAFIIHNSGKHGVHSGAGSGGGGSGAGSSGAKTAGTGPVSVALSAALPAAPGSFPARFFGPYLDSSSTSTATILSCPCSYVSLGFMVAGIDGKLSWNGNQPLNAMTGLVSSIRSKKKDCIVSFGGEAGQELAVVMKDVNALANSYISVVKMYGFKWVDYDIEGSAYKDRDSVLRRNRALVILQKQVPGLTLSYTFPTINSSTVSLPQECVDIVRDAKAVGVKVHVVNLMLMFWGTAPTGALCIQAATAAYNQLVKAGCPVAIGICPCLGTNEDSTSNKFTISDAQTLVAWAKKTSWVRWATFWSIGRDNAATSTTPQSTFQFSSIFNSFR